jgi:hypothetical protein
MLSGKGTRMAGNAQVASVNRIASPAVESQLHCLGMPVLLCLDRVDSPLQPDFMSGTPFA